MRERRRAADVAPERCAEHELHREERNRIDLADVSRHFGRRWAVSHVSLTAQAGDIVGLLGPNGAGKSTLIGMMATLVTPSSGTITYGGADPSMAGAAIRAPGGSP